MLNAATTNHATADSAEIHRNAYNAAFYELGLKWHWDTGTFTSLGLLPQATEEDRIKFYLGTHQSHLLNAYDADFLICAIQEAKERCYGKMQARAERTNVEINWAEIHVHEVGA